MANRGKPRIMCINCNVCVNTLRRYPALELDTRATSLLTDWVYPQIITQEDVVCEACKNLAMAKVNDIVKQEIDDDIKQEVADNNSQPAGPSPRGHANVCPLCGYTLLRRRSDKIFRENPSEMDQAIADLIKNKIAPRQIAVSDRVCHACWVRTKREVTRLNCLAQSLLSLKEDPLEYQNPDPTESPIESPSSTPVSTPSETNHTVDVQKIVLPNYRRAANVTVHCVFPDCNSTTKHSISDKLRAIVLSNHNYYLPKVARVCAEHLMSNSWQTLFDSKNSIETFTVEQIEHVFSFINAFNTTLDFENIQDIDDRVFEYCTGVTKEKFNNLLEQVPQIKEIRRGSLGLAALLMKKRTGDANEKISRLVQVPRRTLETLMAKVREVLCQDFVLENL